MILLYEDLNHSHILDWADKNNMKIKDDKFECMRHGPQQDIKHHTSYQVNQLCTEHEEYVQDMKVTKSTDVSFMQYNCVIKLAIKING